jgi:hypothetical protein
VCFRKHEATELVPCQLARNRTPDRQAIIARKGLLDGFGHTIPGAMGDTETPDTRFPAPTGLPPDIRDARVVEQEVERIRIQSSEEKLF